MIERMSEAYLGGDPSSDEEPAPKRRALSKFLTKFTKPRAVAVCEEIPLEPANDNFLSQFGKRERETHAALSAASSEGAPLDTASAGGAGGGLGTAGDVSGSDDSDTGSAAGPAGESEGSDGSEDEGRGRSDHSSERRRSRGTPSAANVVIWRPSLLPCARVTYRAPSALSSEGDTLLRQI